jgi:IclR family pca regulon transcriptional regulator
MRTTQPPLNRSRPALSSTASGAPRPGEPVGDPLDDGAGEFVQSLARGLAVIEAFSGAEDGLTLADAARRTGLSRASVRRLLHTLESLGYARCDGRRFRLQPRVLRLGSSYLRSEGLSDAAQPHMVELVEAIHESCSAAVLDGSEIVYVARVPVRARLMSLSLGIGSRLPAALTSMGRVLLAGLDPAERAAVIGSGRLPGVEASGAAADAERLARELETVRRQGYALVDQELEPGLRSIAVPIVDGAGRTVAALNVGTHAARVTIERLRREILPPLRLCAQRIGDGLAGRSADPRDAADAGALRDPDVARADRADRAAAVAQPGRRRELRERSCR